MSYFGMSSGGFWSLIPLPLIVHVHLLPPTHSEGKKKIVVLLSEHGMSTVGESEELPGFLGGAAWKEAFFSHCLKEVLQHLAHIWTPAFQDLN